MATLAGVGAFAEIRQAGRYPDGRFDLLAAATGRFAIESVDAQTEPYLLAEVTPLDDEVGDEPRAERLAAAAIRRFVRYLDLMRAREGETTEVLDIRVEIESQPTMAPTGRRPTRRWKASSSEETARADADLHIPDDPTVLSYLLSGIVQVELPRRQALLEARDDGRASRWAGRAPGARARAADASGFATSRRTRRSSAARAAAEAAAPTVSARR